MSWEQSIPDAEKQLEVRSAQVYLHGVQIVDEAREKSEERFLLEANSLFLVEIGNDEDENWKDFRQVMGFGLVNIATRRIAMILDHVHDEAGHGIQCLKRIIILPCSHGLQVASDTSFGTYTEE